MVQWDKAGRSWRPIFKPMPTERSDATALGHKHYLIVAGGSSGGAGLAVVEVLDTCSVEWSTLADLPVPIHGLVQSMVHLDPAHPHQDTWYLMGWEKGRLSPPTTLCVSLKQLLGGGRDEPHSSSWLRLPDPPLACCGAVVLKGCLLAVGGRDKSDVLRRDIFLYLPGTCEWLHVADLPTARHSACCIALSSHEMMVIGGCETRHSQFSSRVDTTRVSL